MSLLDAVIIMVSLISIATDLYRRRIYNVVLLPAVVLAIVYRVLNGGWAGAIDGLTGLVVGMAFLIIPYFAGGVGAGDVKLLGTIGACGGPMFVLYTFLAGAVMGGVASCYLLIKGGRLWPAFKGACLSIVLPGSARLFLGESGMRFPYGVMFCLGVFVAFWLR
ncbi:MAG: A24 family peptidase [Bacillota bacterium]